MKKILDIFTNFTEQQRLRGVAWISCFANSVPIQNVADSGRKCEFSNSVPTQKHHFSNPSAGKC